jgi:PAS domain S-box-containing protein
MADVLIDDIFKDIVETIREPLLVLDSDLKVVLASHSFYGIFKVKPEETVGQLVYDLGNKQWDIPRLRELLETILPEKTSFDDYEVEHDFATIGRRTMLLNARQIERGMGKEKVILLAIEDITECKQVKEPLRESDKKYRILLETTSEGFWLLNPERKTIEVNTVICKMLGYSQDEMLGKTPFDFVDDENRKIFIEQTSKISDTEHRSYEITLKKRNGEDLHTYFNATTIRDESGEIQGSFALITDMTEKKRSEEALRESEERYRMIFNNAPLGIMHFDANGIIRDFNDNFTQIMAAPRENILRFNMLERLHDKEMLKAVKDSLNGQLGYYEGDYLSVTGGKTTSMRAIYQTIISEDGKFLGAVGLFEDISERKQAEQALRESEEKYRSMMEAMDDEAYICSSDFLIEYMNPAMKKSTGYDAIGELCYKVMHGLDEKCPWCSHGKVMKGEHVKTEVVSLKTGRTYHVSNSPIFHTDGSVSNLSIFRDITAIKKMAEQLQQAQKMESIGNLAGGIAHDFNNILSSVIGFTELSLDEVEKGTHIEDSLQEIYTAGKRAKDLVKQILAFARQSEEELKPIQIDTIATEVLKFIRSSIPTTIEIKQNIESDSLIMGNATQVHQILMNLFTNASHAMEDTGGILEFSLKDVLIDRGVTRKKLGLKPGNYIEIKVSDTGAGIAPEIIGSIFDPYFTSKGPGEGTGMGLAMVHGIVESYGGKISVDSKAGQGTLFTVYLPVTRKRHEHGPYQLETLPTGTERILFVDDEAPIAKMVGQALERLGYTVSIRPSSIEALELFRSKPNDFDLVITDMEMPNMTGDKLAVEIIKIRPDIPVILCTGYSKKISSENASESGIRAFAYKPVVRADLAKTVRKVLDDQQQEQTTGRILLIDDDSEIRKLFVQKLAGRGYEIIEACDGKEGLKLYHETRPDLVITDLVMPEKEGLETITELKREFPDVKIIAISGGGRNVPDAYLHIAKNLGAERTFSKPIDWPELIKAVRELLK